MVAAAVTLSGCENPNVAKLLDSLQGRRAQNQTAPPPPAPNAAQLPDRPAAAVDTAPLSPALETATASPAPERIILTPPAGRRSAIRVGLLLPLSGPQAALGDALLDAAQLALFDFADERFQLIVRDTQGRPEVARDAAASAIAEGAGLLLGPLLSSSVEAVAPVARAAGVNVIAFSNQRAVAGSGIYIMGFVPRDQVERVVLFAAARQARRFAAIVPDNAYGQVVASDLDRAARLVGGAVTALEFTNASGDALSALVRRFARYDERRAVLHERIRELEARNDPSLKSEIEKLRERDTLGPPPFDAVLIPEGGDRLRELVPLLAYYDIDGKEVRLLGTRQWDEAGIGAEPGLIGGWFVAPPPAARARFEKHFGEIFGHPPARLASLAYDATALAALLARRAETVADFSAATLTSPSGFAGTDGIFRFRADGVAERGLAVLEVRARAPRVISPAPESFSLSTN